MSVHPPTTICCGSVNDEPDKPRVLLTVLIYQRLNLNSNQICL